MALKSKAREVEEEEDETQTDSDSDEETYDPTGEDEVEEDEEEAPKKMKAKTAKKKVEEEEDEQEEEEEEEEKPRKVAKSSAKKKVVSIKKKVVEKPRRKKTVHNWERHDWKTPFTPGKMVGTIFLRIYEAGETGVKLITVKKWIAELRQSKKGGTWVLSDIRKGTWNGGTWECWEKNGRIGIRKLRMVA